MALAATLATVVFGLAGLTGSLALTILFAFLTVEVWHGWVRCWFFNVSGLDAAEITLKSGTHSP